MALYSVAQGALVNALDILQFKNLLTGNMNDQQVSISNRIRAQATGAAAGTGGWIGQTATGAPTTGTWVIGDFVTTSDGHMWICTVAGTPGTWKTVTFV